MDKGEEEMSITKKRTKDVKPIPKTQIGLDRRQKDILKSFAGRSPKPPIDLNTVREWDKYGDR